MKVKTSHMEDGEFFDLKEGLCSCKPPPVNDSEIDFIFVQIDSGPKHSSNFSVPACKKCHMLMVSKERLERYRNEKPL